MHFVSLTSDLEPDVDIPVVKTVGRTRFSGNSSCAPCPCPCPSRGEKRADWTERGRMRGNVVRVTE